VSRGNTYLYRVRAVSAEGTLSPPSAVEMATAVSFLDVELVGANDPLGRAATRVKAQHVNDLRLAVGGVRRAAGLPSATWQETVSAGLPVRAAHVRELRERLDEGLSALGLPTSSYTDSTLQTGPTGTRIKKTHVEELRARSTRGSGVSGSGLTAYDFAAARLDPNNRTGGGGVDALSRNFNWSLPLVSLPGRSGLDLGLSLTYNSLVWTRSGDYVLFDGDWGWPAPGFRLGFPVVQEKFYDTRAQKNAYLMVTPSGGRVSLRQTATPTIYEAGDSSYLQLTENADGSLTLTAPGGTRMSYWPQGGAYKCTEVKDRNGNFITAEYNGYGNLEAITDTLGREINFGYHADGYLKEITQTWRREVEGASPLTETHRWARFYYEDRVVRTSFPGLAVFGPANGQTFRALTGVTLADDSSFAFDYTTWGQVYQVTNHAKDNRPLNYVRLNLPADETQPQTDCPRPAARRDWAAYWNGDGDGVGAVGEEAVTAYSSPESATWVNPGTGTQDAGTLSTMTTPDGTVYKEYSHASGWDKGLSQLTEVWAGGARKKWTSTAWTQDNDTLQYEQNPRVREMNVYDPEGNRRRTEIVYAAFGLPEDVKEYDADAVTVLRRTHTEYVPDSVNADGKYTAKRIIGLPSARYVYGREGGQEKLLSKLSYEYDSANTSATQYLADAGPVAQHDSTNFGAGLNVRGNVCRTRRWDATDPENQSKSVASETGYNSLGSVLFTGDALSRRTMFSYADSDGGARLAYPTKVTDPEDYFSTLEYNYDTGAVTRAVDPKGAATKTFYDASGRRLKVKSEVNGAYAAWEYAASGLYVKQYTTVDAGLPETFVMSVVDGAGRLRGTLRELPSSMSGGYAARRFTYDNVGRQTRQYNPAEVTVDTSDLSDISVWQPAGADSPSNGGFGWVYAEQTYDWKGRPLTVRNPGSPATTKEFLYGGCGCAGGEVVTTRDEVGRRQKITFDILGRVAKTQVLFQQDKSQQLSAGTDADVYSTVTSTYNGRGQPVEVRAQAGVSGDAQVTTMTYDGHGRLQSRHVPAQDTGGLTIFTYNADDTTDTVTDARGVKTIFGYNSRRLVTLVCYNLSGVIPEQNVAPTPSVTLSYDAAGNRARMTDGFGTVEYQYDMLSRLVSETRTFSDPANTSINGVAQTLSYDYNLGGELKSVIDPTGNKISYAYDRTGRLASVTGTSYGGAGTYASGMQYRAWGAIKGLSYGNGRTLVVTYNSRLQVESYQIPGVIATQYRYTTTPTSPDDDGLVKFAQDLTQVNSLFDRAYRYDHVGRLTEALTGSEAQGGAAQDGPYYQSFGYDVWDNLTSRGGRHWSQPADGYTADYTNGRNDAWTYDADGRPTREDDLHHTYDAPGRMVNTSRPGPRPSLTITADYDGDGRRLKRTAAGEGTTYFLSSSVLGGRVMVELTSINGAWRKRRGYVYLGAEMIAEQDSGLFGDRRSVRWLHTDPVTGRRRGTTVNGTVTSLATEPDPLGVDAGAVDPYLSGDAGAGGGESDLVYPKYGDALNLSSGCFVDGQLMSCDSAIRIGRGEAVDAGTGLFAVDMGGTRGPDPYGTNILTRPESRSVRVEVLHTQVRVVGEAWSAGRFSFAVSAEGALAGAALDSLPQNPARQLTPDEVATLRGEVAKMLMDRCASFIDKLVGATTDNPYDSKKSLLTDLDNIANYTGRSIFFTPLMDD
jgi:YD repeat-containing protein